MAEGHEAAEWNRTSHLLAAILNSAPFVTESVHPWQLNPYSKRPEPKESTIDAIDLAYMFCGQDAIDAFAKADAEQAAAAAAANNPNPTSPAAVV